ncbi:MAG: hypothetical protein O7D96_11005, partial [SAR324 cluster bacterium]|nr:hypothetical protein [SAR324 cluster bacterium]
MIAREEALDATGVTYHWKAIGEMADGMREFKLQSMKFAEEMEPMKPAGIVAAFALAAIGVTVAMSVALTAVMPAQLRAAVFGNPVPNIAEGEQAVGVSFTDDRLTGFYDRGVSPQGVA